MSTSSRLVKDLRDVAGVSPSWHFLHDCCSALGNTASADHVLQQILHHDLRDVVRVLEAEVGGGTALTRDNIDSLPSVQLRRAISNSRLPASNFKTTLPESFRLMVQIEELQDMALGTEARYSNGTSNNNNSHAASWNPPTTTQRCLKLLLSDGYYADGTPVEQEPDQENILNETSSQNFLLVAMEITPISELSTHSHAGIKALLKGPIVVRHGMLQVHTGNLIVLGGVVSHLAEAQKQALQQAQRRAGVDPTIRALIGPEGLTESQDDDDEGEGESSDVPPQAARHLVATVHNPLQQQPSQATATRPGQPTQRVTGHSQSSTTRSVSPYATTNNFTASGNVPGPSMNSNAGRPFQSAAPSLGSTTNPVGSYANASSSSQSLHGGEGPATYTSPPDSALAAQSSMAANPYARSSATSTIASTRPSGHTPQSISPALSNPQSSSSSTGPMDTTPQASSGRAQPLSSLDLQSLLQQLKTNQNLYRQIVDKSYSTMFQQDGVKLYFNIEKKKKDSHRKDDKKDEKYEYAMSARFKSPGSDQLVTCKIASSILEPFFGAKPSDMRKMNREDKQRANDLVREGGRKVQELLNGQHKYEWMLAMSPEEYFALTPAQDGTVPILLLLNLQD